MTVTNNTEYEYELQSFTYANGVVFYCFAVKAGGDFAVVIDPAA